MQPSYPYSKFEVPLIILNILDNTYDVEGFRLSITQHIHSAKNKYDSNTYIIGHYNPSVRIIDLVSHTTYVVCVNFIDKWRDLQFKVGSERQIFWETFHGNFIWTLRVFARNLLRGKSPKKYFSYFVLMSGLGLEPWLFV